MVKSLEDCYILLVGAGGIGCEVIKNLVLSGITKVDIIDLDTIDVSNLNRQFLVCLSAMTFFMSYSSALIMLVCRRAWWPHKQRSISILQQ